MPLKLISAAEQLEEVETMIEFFRLWHHPTERRMDTLKVIAADLRSRLPKAPPEAVADLEPKLKALQMTHRGSDPSAKIAVAEQVIRHWPTIRQALEFYSHHVSRPEVARG